jgi:hypothetical protein
MSEVAVKCTKAQKGEAGKKVPVSSKTTPEFSQAFKSPVDQVLNLQRTIGNRAVNRLIQSGALQAKLKIGLPNDIYRKETDRIKNLSESILVQRRNGSPNPVPTLVIQQPTANTVFNINATPQMPTINCSAIIQGVNPDPTSTTNFNWGITVLENVAGGGCASARIGNCTSSYQFSSQGGNLTPPLSTIQGGRTEIRAEADVGGSTLSSSVNVSIIGTNPGAGVVSTECGGAGTDADRIACWESRRRQFNANGTPLLGGGGDVGIMQLCNPAATCAQRWNWIGNVGAGVALLQQKRSAARRYLNHHQDANGNYPNDLNLNNTEVLQRETMQRYNGGTYWTWNARRNRWEANPPNNYVNNVLSCS